MKREKGSPVGLYTIGVAALFLAGFFLLVVFGAQSYRGTVNGQNDNVRTRTLLSYLATVLHGSDTRGAVAVEETEDGPILHVTDGSTGFELRIYRHDGSLVEDYAAAGSPLRPEGAQTIGETERFVVERPADDLLRIGTDAGDVLLRLRSEGGAS